MQKKIIKTDKAPAAVGPYSQAVCANGFLFVSGQLPADPKTGELIRGDIVGATKTAMMNIQNVLQAAGSSWADVVKATIYLKNMDDFMQMNEVYASFFPDSPPARVCVAASRLPKDADIEIEVIATGTKI